MARQIRTRRHGLCGGRASQSRQTSDDWGSGRRRVAGAWPPVERGPPARHANGAARAANRGQGHRSPTTGAAPPATETTTAADEGPPSVPGGPSTAINGRPTA
eukprot:CAMPEP_0174379886 /NCGR_PEP_ID=MMETSP0811_2-20130205/122997_1 /TAXON_ID=73025 ORGANISM="Eutreptiella gymnastica-like, Strain CCMP1594" /NCGR_SAMPLE_ID=MMETSP0811_2 /ASSEMBLY_ACC=CAM_ASM_000667 /LENGTH=102 /DNA_ID=CAMNT_0015532547 /DNA_START=670 /DNA_END=974 /DNA_ORIENTATION=+